MRIPLVFRVLCGAALLIHCSPDFDALQVGLNAAGGKATGGNPSASGAGGDANGGDSSEMGGSAQTTGGTLNSGGRSSGTAGDSGGEDVSAGSGGRPQGGSAGAAGNPQGGAPEAGGPSSGGTAGEGGADGGSGGATDPAIPPPSTTCKDGCLDIYVPFTKAGQTQFFTIQIGDVDLSKSTITALVRFKSYPGNGAFIKVYASSYDFDYYGGVGLDAIVVGQEKTLSLDLSGTPKNQQGLPWKNNRVGSFGLQVFTDGSSTKGGPVHVEVEEISISESAIGPWKFTTEAGIAEVTVNNYQPVPNSAKHWVAPALTTE